MGVEHAPEIVWRAQDLYCVDRLSFTAVSKALGVADSTLRRWAEKFGWKKEREEIARAESEIRAKTVKARSYMLEKLLTASSAGDAAQGAFGVSALEKLELEKQKALAKSQAPALQSAAEAVRSQDEKETPPQKPFDLPDGLGGDERLALLEDAVNKQLGYILANPVSDLSRRVREIKAAMDVLAAMKGKDAGSASTVITFEE